MYQRFVLLALAAASLTACEPTKTQEYYASHPQELAADLAACKQQSMNTFNCNEATKAALSLGAAKKE